MARQTPEWIGKTPDSPIPTRVRLRVFNDHGGKCYLTYRKINVGDKWQIDHIVALVNGGENRENNLAPVLDAPHKTKTKQDVADKSKVNRLRQKHFGMADKKSGFRKPTGTKYNWKKGRYENNDHMGNT